MSSYIKISYPTNPTNQALMRCVMYIGEYYGKNKKDKLDEGITYLAKKVKGASKRSIRFMIYSQKVNQSQMRCWRFKKNSFYRAYEYIINRLLNKKIGDRELALQLLHDLYIEQIKKWEIEKNFSDILLYQQMEALEWAIDKQQYKKWQGHIDKIIKECKASDIKYRKYLEDGMKHD